MQWLRDGLGVIERADETSALAGSLEGNEGVYFVPALTGLGSPHWDPYARGTIVGLTRGSGRAHLARAALEAIAYQTVDAVRAMEEAGSEPLAELKADGGATVNPWLMQFQADVLGVPVVAARGGRDDGAGRRLPRRGRSGPPHARPRARRLARACPLRARDGRRRADGAAGRLGPRGRARQGVES